MLLYLSEVYNDSPLQAGQFVFVDEFEFGEDFLFDFAVKFIRYFFS